MTHHQPPPPTPHPHPDPTPLPNPKTETHYFGLWFQSKAQMQRWVELEKALKKQLDKFGNEPLLFFGVMFYVPNVSRLEQEVTRSATEGLDLGEERLEGGREGGREEKSWREWHGVCPIDVKLYPGTLLSLGVHRSCRGLLEASWACAEGPVSVYTGHMTSSLHRVLAAGHPITLLHSTGYQYYLQVKKEVLDGRLQCGVEQGIRLAGLAVQADFGDYNQFQSQDFLREYVLFPVIDKNDAKQPASTQRAYKRLNWAHVDDVLEEWTHKVAEEHKSHCGMPPAEAELLYIKEVEKLDGFGQESFAAKDNYTNDIYIGVSFIGVFVKHRNGRSIMLHRWKDIGNIAHNKSAITVEITSRDDTIMFHTVSAVTVSVLTAELSQAQIPAHSPAPIRRRPTWNRSSLPRPRSCILQPMHSQYAEHYQDTQSSQDSIFHDDPYYKSETSLDRCPVDFGFRNGSVYSTPSLNSIQASPMSSNLSIPGSDIMRPDYIPSHRHSAIIAPTYRPTPEYEAVMRQKRCLVPADCHSQSLRNLNISNAFAYRQPEALLPPNCGASAAGQGSSSAATGSAISHTVSTPELANTATAKQCIQGYSATHMLRNHLSRPPPPYPSFRPATSTPDLASHRHKCLGGSSPELVSRKVQLSVKTFQPDSSAVVHQSMQEVSEPLTAAKHHSALSKRHSLEVISNMVRGMEAMALKTLNAPLPRRNTLREQVVQPPPPPQPQPQAQPPPPPPEMSPAKPSSDASSSYQHRKTLSNATMLIHSSESEEDISAQLLQAALAKIPNKPPPEYPGPRRAISNSALRPGQGQERGQERARDRSHSTLKVR
ncbi:hypothetical protein JZ751_004793 [Albula glossodonta]|uniref:protein-tyrosine-phosphatase n=1 Tax=Albula glossodonta TaxID=121402 RepID=A0A8T2P6D7_9TELE|nr:hypothetical protein JZ751_004793 [Albula glossodonta]